MEKKIIIIEEKFLKIKKKNIETSDSEYEFVDFVLSLVMCSFV